MAFVAECPVPVLIPALMAVAAAGILCLLFHRWRTRPIARESDESVSRLRESEERYRQVFENTSDGLFLLDVTAEGRFRFAGFNPAEEQSLGIADRAANGRLVEEVLSADLSKQVTANYLRCLNGGEAITYEESLALPGGVRHFHTTLMPVRDAAGRIARLIGIARDITERTQMMKALETSNRHGASLLRLSRNIERARTYAELAQAAFNEVHKVMGYNRLWIYTITEDQQEADGLLATTSGSPMALPHLKIAGDPMLEEIVFGDHIVVVEDALTDPRTDKEIVEKQGHRTLINVPIILFDNHLGSIGTGTFNEEGVRAPTDAEREYLTSIASHLAVSLDRIHTQIQRDQAEEELHRYRDHLEELVTVRTKDLEAANRELEAFAYSVSHDLRAPLRAIEGFSLLLERKSRDNLDDEGKRLLGVIRESTEKMGQLINDILAFSRSGHGEIHYTDVSMNEVVHSVWDGLESARSGRNIQLELGDLPPARGDASMLGQVWENLILNAIKFTRNRSDARIAITGRLADGSLEYSIRDNGAGFDPAFAGRLFGMFQRLHGVDEFEGTGVGLAIVKRILERHGGTVAAEGEVGSGATFRFTLPAGG